MDDKHDELENMLENLDQPTVGVSGHQKEFRLTLLNTKKSAIAGSILLILPFLFLCGVILKHYLKIDFGLFTAVYEWIGQADQAYGDRSILNWIIRILLVLGPLAAIAINLLAVTHVRYEKIQNEVVIGLKLKWFNWSLIVICSMIFLIFFLYLIIENA